MFANTGNVGLGVASVSVVWAVVWPQSLGYYDYYKNEVISNKELTLRSAPGIWSGNVCVDTTEFIRRGEYAFWLTEKLHLAFASRKYDATRTRTILFYSESTRLG